MARPAGERGDMGNVVPLQCLLVQSLQRWPEQTHRAPRRGRRHRGGIADARGERISFGPEGLLLPPGSSQTWRLAAPTIKEKADPVPS